MSSTSVEFDELGEANGFGASLVRAAPSGGRLPLRGSSSNATPPADIYSSCSGSQAPAVPASRPRSPPGNVPQPSAVADDRGGTTPFAANSFGEASGTARRRVSGGRPDVVRAAAASAFQAAITLLLAAKGASVPAGSSLRLRWLLGRHAGGHWHLVWVVTPWTRLHLDKCFCFAHQDALSRQARRCRMPSCTKFTKDVVGRFNLSCASFVRTQYCHALSRKFHLAHHLLPRAV